MVSGSRNDKGEIFELAKLYLIKPTAGQASSKYPYWKKVKESSIEASGTQIIV